MGDELWFFTGDKRRCSGMDSIVQDFEWKGTTFEWSYKK